MNENEILEKIIEEEGSCSWANPSICKSCPLGSTKKYDSEEYMSCVESIGIVGLSEAEADAKYKLAATEALQELILEAAIRGNDGPK